MSPGRQESALGAGLNAPSALYISTALWNSVSDATAANRIVKNGSTATISGTAPASNACTLGHDPTNSYLLVLDSATTIKRYSGIAGTTITFVDSITLDTAVSIGAFLFDNTNSQYICVNAAGTSLLRFNSAGVLQQTVALPSNIGTVHGVTIVGNRIFTLNVVGQVSLDTVSTDGGFSFALLPTAMTLT
jgi:hypothetical protein